MISSIRPEIGQWVISGWARNSGIRPDAAILNRFAS